MNAFYKGNGLLFLMAGIGLSIPWLAAGKANLGRKSAYQRFKRKGSTRHLDWYEFELLIGEFLRRQGYKVDNNTNNGPDGGIDIRVTKKGKKGIVQCKHYKTSKCSVNVVRELYGVQKSENLDFSIVACTSGFSKDAWDFAMKNKIRLLSERDLKSNKPF